MNRQVSTTAEQVMAAEDRFSLIPEAAAYLDHRLTGPEALIAATVMAAFAADRIAEFKIALADTIRCPMGVVPNSAEGLLTQAEIAAAEDRRIGGHRAFGVAENGGDL